MKSWPYSISGQAGRRLQLSLQVSDPSLGGKFHTGEVSALWVEYFTPPWAKLHALALLYSGGAGIGDKRSFFALGGFVDQDVVRSLFLSRPQCCFFLRGYPAASIFGDQYHLLSTEYRLPLLWIEKGYQTFPLYLRRVSGAVFTDVGNAYQGTFHASDLKVGVGAELRFEIEPGVLPAHADPVRVRQGAARPAARRSTTSSPRSRSSESGRVRGNPVPSPVRGGRVRERGRRAPRLARSALSLTLSRRRERGSDVRAKA